MSEPELTREMAELLAQSAVTVGAPAMTGLARRVIAEHRPRWFQEMGDSEAWLARWGVETAAAIEETALGFTQAEIEARGQGPVIGLAWVTIHNTSRLMAKEVVLAERLYAPLGLS